MELLKAILKQKNFMFRLGLVFCLIWLVIAIIAPVLPLQDPLLQSTPERFQSPTGAHWFGTDSLGRDVFSRVLHASRTSLTAGIVTVLISFLFGMMYGALAGYVGGFVDDVMMRISEIIMSFPPLILAMVIAAALGPSILNSVLAMAIIWWPNYARLTRSIVIAVKNNEYVTASKILGANHFRILVKEVLPNCIGPLIVMATLDLGNAILMFSGLSFLGLGVQPPNPEWGAMVSEGVETFQYWWISTFPGLAIFSIAIAANFVGDGMRDILDPKLKTREV